MLLNAAPLEIDNSEEKPPSLVKSANAEEMTRPMKENAYVNTYDGYRWALLSYAAVYILNPEFLLLFAATLLLFIWVIVVPRVKSAYSSASPPKNKKATEKLLSTAKNAGARRVTWLIKKGADVNAIEEDGKTPLILAAESNSNPGVPHILLEKGADVNAVDDYYERTPLMYAAFKNSNPEVLMILIDNDADVAMRDY